MFFNSYILIFLVRHENDPLLTSPKLNSTAIIMCDRVSASLRAQSLPV